MEHALFPLFLRLEGRRCVVVGAGPVGESKIASLLPTGARVRVVAPHATEAVEHWVQEGEIEIERREFRPGDLEGACLVVAAVKSRDVCEAIFREARSCGVFCNAVDDPPHCDFFYPAVVRRGSLQIAISTTGHSPALAQRLRQQFEQEFGPEYQQWLERLGTVRRGLMRRSMEASQRRELLHRFAAVERFERFRRRALRGNRG